MRHGYIKASIIEKIRNLLKTIVLDADVEKYTEIKSLFYRSNQSVGSVIKVTEDEMLQLETLLSSIGTQSDAAKFVFFLANKRCSLNKPKQYYFQFDDRADHRIYSIKALRYLVDTSEFIKEFGTMSSGLRFIKMLIESNVFIGPINENTANVFRALVEQSVPRAVTTITTKPKRGYSSLIDVAKAHNYGFEDSRL